MDGIQQFYTYEQWLNKSIKLFTNAIPPVTNNLLDEKKDYQLACEKNQQLLAKLHSISTTWISWSTFSQLKIQDLVKIITHDILVIEPIQSSSFILLCRVKLCIEDLKIISAKEILKTDSNLATKKTEIPKLKKLKSKWFYELIVQTTVQKGIDEIVETLTARIEKYSNRASCNAEEKTPSLHPSY